MLKEAIYHRPKNNWASGDKFNWHKIGHQDSQMKVFARDSLFDYWQAEVQPAFHRLKYGFNRYSVATEQKKAQPGNKRSEVVPHSR